MKIVKDKKKIFNVINKNFSKFYMYDIKFILDKIVDEYDLLEPIVTDIKIVNDYDYDLIITLKDKDYDIMEYKVILSKNINDLILVKLSNQDYLDGYKLNYMGDIKLIKEIYENKKNNTVIEKVNNNLDDLHLINYNSNQLDEYDNIYINYKYNFKNEYMDSFISIDISKTHPYVENLFIKNIINNIEIKDINTLFYVIKKNIGDNKININIKNKSDKGIEVFNYQNGKIVEYRKINDDKIIEYNNEQDKVLVTRFEKDNLENAEFQKVLKLVRS